LKTGVTVRGPGGTLLVEANRASKFLLEVDVDKGVNERLIVQDSFGSFKRDVTEETQQGKISGLLRVRDHHAARLRADINTIAKALGDEFNAIHRQGYGLKEYAETKGRNFFDGLDEGGEPGRLLRVSEVIRADPDAIAGAMTPSASGDNVVANKLIQVFYKPIIPGKEVTLAQHYDDVVAKLGIDSRHSAEAEKAANIVVAQVEAQREAASGVSLDEEAANLLKYQHLFTASSKLITTADEMFRTVLDLKR
jgi:flagellar hook-associated protein 1